MHYRVRRVRPEDWPRLRALRLEALRDTPLAYDETHALAASADEQTWRARARHGAESDDDALWIAETDAGAWVAMAGVRRGPERCATLVQVYVDPAHRGAPARLAERLVRAAARWARAGGRASRLRLLVHEANPRARACYARLGFTATGRDAPYALAPGGREIEMAMELEPTRHERTEIDPEGD